MHAGGIRAHNLSRLAAADLCLKPRGRLHFGNVLYVETNTKVNGYSYVPTK